MTMRRHLDVEVPGDPVPWKRPEPSARGGRRTNPRDEAHRSVIALYASRAAGQQRAAVLGKGCPVQVHLTFWCNTATLARCDVDNLAKAVLDALKGIAYADDKQVAALFARKVRSTEPHTSITVFALEPSPTSPFVDEHA